MGEGSVVKEITIKELYDFFVDTLQSCGTHLLNTTDDEIEYEIFEQLDIGVVSFFHEDSLKWLHHSGFISSEIVEKGSEFRKKVYDIQTRQLWNINAVRNSQEWYALLSLADEIKTMIKKQI
jgi:hypothetical protein